MIVASELSRVASVTTFGLCGRSACLSSEGVPNLSKKHCALDS